MFEPKYNLTKEVLGLIENKSQYRASLRSYQAIETPQGYYDSLVLDFEIVGISQFPIYPIQPCEPIEIRIYENDLPNVIVLRPNFPAVPHLDIYDSDQTKHLCYSDVSYNEMRHKLNGFFLLECINNWFVMTARNELHQPDQSLEPFFPYVKNNIIIGIDYIWKLFCRFRLVQDNNNSTLIQVYDNEEKLEADYYAVHTIQIKSDTTNIMHSLPSTLHELVNLFPEQDIQGSIRNWLSQLLSIKRDAEKYQRLFKQESTRLMNCRSIIYLYVPLSRDENKSPESYELKAFVIQKNLSEFMNDFGLRVDKSKAVYSKERDNCGKNIVLSPHNIHLDFTRIIAQTMNSLSKEESGVNIVQIGTGALGSQIYHNCLRAGYGNWAIIDNDCVLPHNLARHILGRDAIGKSKVDSIKQYAQLIVPDANIRTIHTDVTVEDNIEFYEALCNADIIIDVSASSGVERFIALDISSDVRRVSFFMNPIGDSTIMLLEDTRRKISLDLLEMQYYQTLISEDKYAAHFKIPGKISYSGTCRSISSRISQDDVAMSAALCSRALKVQTKKEDSQIIIWTRNEDSVIADKMQGNSWLSSQVKQWRVYLYQPLLNHMNNRRATKLPNETGGVLIGSYDCFRKILYIVDMVAPPIDSIESHDSFIRGCKDLPEKVQEIFNRSAENLYYIGEWHSHPNSNIAISNDDKILLQAIVEYNQARCLPGCMIILGNDKHSIYLEMAK